MVDYSIFIDGFSQCFAGSSDSYFKFNTLLTNDFRYTSDIRFSLYEDNVLIASIYLVYLSDNSYYVIILKHKKNIYEYLGLSLYNYSVFLKKYDIHIFGDTMVNAFI